MHDESRRDSTVFLVNNSVFDGAKRMEKRQMKQYGDKPAYREYADKTPVILPLLPIYHLNKKG